MVKTTGELALTAGCSQYFIRKAAKELGIRPPAPGRNWYFTESDQERILAHLREQVGQRVERPRCPHCGQRIKKGRAA